LGWKTKEKRLSRERRGRGDVSTNIVLGETRTVTDPVPPTATAVELFSGIGGMRLALEESNALKDGDATVARFIAIDNNVNANDVYKANFQNSLLIEGNIENVDAKSLILGEGGRCEILMMSPPCQPYTRKGKKEREKDARSTALAFIIDIFEDMDDVCDEDMRPKRILLENVVGFELGAERERFIQALKKKKYHVREFVGLSPETMLGVPVKRPRYYLLARTEEFGRFDDDAPWMSQKGNVAMVENIAQYLDEDVEMGLEVERKKIEKYWKFFDIVNTSSSNDNLASTFTSGYGKTIFSGSFILFKDGEIAKRDVNANNAYRLVNDDDENNEQFAERISKSLRYFSPSEICRLHGIRDSFVFPSSLSKRQRYKLIGNGISVQVVAKLLEYLFK
tara:strand:- start:74 stop:1255 length:1182 start_codon:yes stop_codon:yes gene_type:complete